MEILLYDTWERSLRPFSPIHADWVGLYCCGPAVYDHAHIGNLRTYLFEDLLRRTLEFNGYTVRHVVNITDVGHLLSDQDEGEDKVERQSRRSGVSAWALAERYTEAFIADLGLLNIKLPTIWCKATDHIEEQIALIRFRPAIPGRGESRPEYGKRTGAGVGRAEKRAARCAQEGHARRSRCHARPTPVAMAPRSR
nr:hypothetical protein [Burkholderia ubonensis]